MGHVRHKERRALKIYSVLLETIFLLLVKEIFAAYAEADVLVSAVIEVQ